ncbi:MAG: hypothetical protein AUJ04_10575 [Acidobacteria bacterium 13_1_40CM_3_55_6]|nr:MAG: hypothetical protein AUJ04_10575 [Acidobacteria bacterium 13_1_40CM_3_55_6]
MRVGSLQVVPLDEAAALTEQRAGQLIALDDALRDLAALDERKSQIIELRFFGGLSMEETAEVMKISSSTVQREWRAAKAWLHHASLRRSSIRLQAGERLPGEDLHLSERACSQARVR